MANDQSKCVFLFDDTVQVDTQAAIECVRTRLGTRASLAQVAQALSDLAPGQGSDPTAGVVTPAQAVRALFDVMDHLPVGICVVDAVLQVRVFNRMARQLLDFPDGLFDGGLPHFRELILFNARRGDYGPGDPAALTEERMVLARKMEPHHFERKRPNGTVLDIRGEPLPGGGFVTIWTDVTARAVAEERLAERNRDLERINAELSATQQQLVQSEKLASIGQLAAGVAHEINNPIGYVHSNIGTLDKYVGDLLGLLERYQQAQPSIADAALAQGLREHCAAVDLEFLKEDVLTLLQESREGITRVKKIVQDLKDFSHVDHSPDWQWADLHQGLESTLNIVANELRYKADVVKEYGILPEVECLPSQLNQVFMNLLVNAAHAMGPQRGCITLRTGVAGEQVWLEFSDTGVGIAPEIQARIFEPFFTTKPVGKGTGLGLSLAYGIIQKHHGSITVRSEVGQGTTFRIELPVHHLSEDPAAVQPAASGA
ncbi:MAG: PAS-domain containing protein [Rhodoferax sp.]